VPVVGVGGCPGSFCDQNRKIPEGVPKNGVFGFKGLYQARCFRQKFGFPPKEPLNLLSFATTNKRRNALYADSSSFHFFELLDKGIVGAEELVPGIEQVAIDFGIQLFHQLQVAHESIVLP
jgi:hypothetical protein